MTEIEIFLRNLVINNHTPSVQYILFGKDNILEQYRYGLADIAANRNVNHKTTYNVFSITKTFTALAILQLAEQRKIDIDRPVKEYLPGFSYSSDITVRQVLSHSAGLPNPIPLDWIHLTTEHKSFNRNRFFKQIYAKNNKIKCRPNQKFAYSNIGYVVLGELIENVSGMSYEQYIVENIIHKLGLKSDELGFEIAEADLQAKGYHKRWSFTNLLLGFFIDKSKYIGKTEGEWKPFHHFYVNGTPYGGLIGTPNAFAKYMQSLLKADNLLLSDDYKKMLFSENHTTNNKATGMCLSWFCGQLNGDRYFAHAGGGGGYYCEIRLYPGKEIGTAIFFNRTGMSDERFLDQVDKFYLDRTKEGAVLY